MPEFKPENCAEVDIGKPGVRTIRHISDDGHAFEVSFDPEVVSDAAAMTMLKRTVERTI
jgi:hypothetical protein